MGKMKNGILDAFSGAIAEQKAKCKVAADFTQTPHDLLIPGFRDLAVQMRGANYGLSLVLTEAIDGAYPDFKIAYDRVKISKGLLPNVGGLAVTPMFDLT
jgi:hypothetical protein